MKKFILLIIVISILIVMGGCSQYATKHYGGHMKIELPVNTKLEQITWKDSELWYLTRPMRDDEEAEVHTFQESVDIGFEGKITITERKEDEWK